MWKGEELRLVTSPAPSGLYRGRRARCVADARVVGHCYKVNEALRLPVPIPIPGRHPADLEPLLHAHDQGLVLLPTFPEQRRTLE